MPRLICSIIGGKARETWFEKQGLTRVGGQLVPVRGMPWHVVYRNPVPVGSIIAFYDGSGTKILYGRRVPGGTKYKSDILVQATTGKGFGRRRSTIVVKTFPHQKRG